MAYVGMAVVALGMLLGVGTDFGGEVTAAGLVVGLGSAVFYAAQMCIRDRFSPGATSSETSLRLAESGAMSAAVRPASAAQSQICLLYTLDVYKRQAAASRSSRP